MKLRLAILALATLAVAGHALAGTPVNVFNVDKQGVVLHGYDVVSYFEGPAPLKGNEKISVTFAGVTWRFSSADNRKKFIQARNKYLPQYGGHCAYAVSENRFADVDPLAYKIVEGKLYLNCDMKVQKIWEADIDENIAKADANWPAMTHPQAAKP
jgi:hypothetical protein